MTENFWGDRFPPPPPSAAPPLVGLRSRPLRRLRRHLPQTPSLRSVEGEETVASLLEGGRSRSGFFGQGGVHAHAVFPDELVFGFLAMLTAVSRSRKHSEALLVYLFTANFAPSIGAILDALEGGVDLLQLTFQLLIDRYFLGSLERLRGLVSGVLVVAREGACRVLLRLVELGFFTVLLAKALDLATLLFEFLSGRFQIHVGALPSGPHVHASGLKTPVDRRMAELT